jgi:8-oxo-dGTP pyrophosphatase MutT (NUDIX family)
MLTEIKRADVGNFTLKVGPEVGPNADALTSLTRGYGPRRGNLEDLLKYWRPIMKKPGGFRRCVVTLMDKPQFAGKPQRICAWLHHESTGKWPNEGNHHGRGGKRRGRRGSVRRVRSAARRAKSGLLLSHTQIIEVSPLRIAVRASRVFGGVLVQPIAGRQSAVDMKAAMFSTYALKIPVNGVMDEKRVGAVGSNSRAGQAVQAVGTIILPGDISDFRSPIRSQIYETLTPGGGGGRGLPSARRLVRGVGRGARNKFRCPPGFEKGGTFTNSQFSTCGAQILGIPGKGVGSPSSGALRALAALARDASLVREIGDLRNNRSPYDIIRAAQIPVAPKKGSPTRRQTSINTVLARTGEADFSMRAVRRDGVILEPVVSVQALGKLDEFDDLVDGTLIDRYDSGQIGKDIVPAFSTGLRDVYVDIPESGAVQISRVGGELSPTEVDSLRRVFPTSVRRAAQLPDPSAGIRDYVDRSNGRFTVEFGELKNNKFEVNARRNKLIRVQTSSGTIVVVPVWVYEIFLSRSAPRRSKNDPIYEIVSDDKTGNPFLLSTKTIASLTHRTSNYYELIEVRAAIFSEGLGSIEVKLGKRTKPTPTGVGGRGARALFDPGLDRYRCPPGTRYGGRITDQFGRNCGYSLPRTVVNSLVDLGVRIEDAMERRRKLRSERGSRRERLGSAIKEKYDNSLNGLADVMDKLAIVLDKTEDKRPGRIGPSLSDRSNAAKLTDEDRNLLGGEPLADALDNLKSVLDDQDFKNPDLPEIQKAYKAVEKAAGLEAGRLTDNPAKTDKDRSMGRRILDAIASILDRLGNFVDPDTSRRDRRERRPAASAAPTPQAPKKFDTPRKPKKLDNFLQQSIGGRRKKVDVPEVRDLSDDDKTKLDAAIQSEFNELSGFWANRLNKGLNEFSAKDIKKYLKVNKDSPDARVERRRYNDWLELNELKRAQDDGKFGGDYEDFVGRLAPNRRESIVSSLKPPEDPPGDVDADVPGDGNMEMPADGLPAVSKDYGPDGFKKERGTMSTVEFLNSLSDEDLENYKQSHIVYKKEVEDAGSTAYGLKNRIKQMEKLQDVRRKLRGESSKPPPTSKDLSMDGFRKERNTSLMNNDIDDFFSDPDRVFIESLTDEEIDGYIKSFDNDMNDPKTPPFSQGDYKRRDMLAAERESRDSKLKSKDVVDNAELEMGDPDPDGFHPIDKVEDAVNNPDLNDTTDIPDSIVDASVNSFTGFPAKADRAAYKLKVYDDMPFDGVDIGKVDPSLLFADPDFDIDSPNTRVGVLVVDRDTGHVMIRHAKGNLGGYGWSFSKGGIDDGETVHDAAMRELFEETGLSADDVSIVGALNGSFMSDSSSKNYFFVAQVSGGANKIDIAGNAETDDLIFANPSDVDSFIDKDSSNVKGKQRDLKIAQALDDWVTGWGASDPKFLNAVQDGLLNINSPTKSSGGIPKDKVTAGKHSPSFVPNTELLKKSEQTDLPLKFVSAKTDENNAAMRTAAAELLAEVGTVDALNDSGFLLTDFDVTDDMFDAISAGDVSRFSQIPTGDVGINGQMGFPTKMFRDTETGNVYVLKKPARNDMEHLSESSAAIVAQDLGLPVPNVTFAGNDYLVSADAKAPNGEKVTKFGDTTNRPMLIEHVGNVLDLNEGGGKPPYNHKQMGAMLAQQYLISEPDNHSLNRLTMVDKKNQTSIFAFDAGKAFLPHEEKFGDQFFGGRFGSSIMNTMPEEDRKAIIGEAQKALSNFDVAASQKRIRGQVEAGKLTDAEAGRLLEMSDFIAERHGSWQTAISKDFADDMLGDVELNEALSSFSKFSIDTPAFTPMLGKTVDPSANPTDPDSYASGIGKVAAAMSVPQSTVASIQAAPAQTVVKALNAKRPDRQLTTKQTTLDGPDIVGSQMSVTDGMMVNVGTFKDPKFVKAIEFRAQLEDHSYEEIVKFLDANPEKVYKIRTDPKTTTKGWDRLVQFGSDGDNIPSSSFSSLTLNVDADNKAASGGIMSTDLFGLDIHSSYSGLAKVVPKNAVQNQDLYVADFGDVKVVLTPDSFGMGGHTKSNVHKQIRVFVTGDSREEMKTSPQEVMERAFNNVGIDASPPSETQIRDTLARRLLRWSTKPEAEGAPGSAVGSPMYGTGYENPVVQNTMLKSMAGWGITPSDLTVRIDSGRPNIVISPEKAKEIVYANSGGAGPDSLGDRMPEYKHKVYSESGLGKLTGSNWVNDDEMAEAIGALYFDGSSSGGLDRSLNSANSIAVGLSVGMDVGNGSADNFYMEVRERDFSARTWKAGTFLLFPEEGVGDLEALYLASDSYGMEHPKDTPIPGGTAPVRLPWGDVMHATPFDYIFKQKKNVKDYSAKGQVSWNNGFFVISNSQAKMDQMEKAVRKANIPVSVLNAQNLVSGQDNGTPVDGYRMMVWVDSPDGPTISWGPEVSSKDLLSSQMTGRLPDMKTVDSNGRLPYDPAEDPNAM